MKPLLLFPTGTDAHKRMNFTGILFASFDELQTFQSNAKFKNAQIVSNGTLYDIKDIAQAIEDTK